MRKIERHPPADNVPSGCAHDVYKEHGRVLHGLGKARKQERTHPPLNSVYSTMLDAASLHPAFRPAANQQTQATYLSCPLHPLGSNVVAILDRFPAGAALLEIMSFHTRTRGRMNSSDATVAAQLWRSIVSPRM